ncbi:hypothetical protein CDIK_2959 [Cucumispora dikerogammari]|nr:hypothetical protein CDIK_2959 [Cucumispora dikerogammari]
MTTVPNITKTALTGRKKKMIQKNLYWRQRLSTINEDFKENQQPKNVSEVPAAFVDNSYKKCNDSDIAFLKRELKKDQEEIYRIDKDLQKQLKNSAMQTNRKHYSQNTHPDHKNDTKISELKRNLEEVGNTNIRLKNMNNQKKNSQRRISLQFSKAEFKEKNKIAVCSVKNKTSCIKSQFYFKDGSSKLRYDVCNDINTKYLSIDKNKANYSITSSQTNKTYNHHTGSSSDNGVSNAKNLSIKEKIDRNYQNIYKNHDTPSLCGLRDKISKIKTIYSAKIQERKELRKCI